MHQQVVVRTGNFVEDWGTQIIIEEATALSHLNFQVDLDDGLIPCHVAVQAIGKDSMCAMSSLSVRFVSKEHPVPTGMELADWNHPDLRLVYNIRKLN